jgi:hypothetical protein
MMSRTLLSTTAQVDLLALAFAFFNGLRTLAYLPTIWTVVQSGRSDQHSLFTWFVWCGANATMAAWIYRNNGQRFDRVVLINVANALLCLICGAVIVCYRF